MTASVGVNGISKGLDLGNLVRYYLPGAQETYWEEEANTWKGSLGCCYKVYTNIYQLNQVDNRIPQKEMMQSFGDVVQQQCVWQVCMGKKL